MPPQIENFDLPDLPEGWAETAMGAVAQVVGGGTPDSKNPANFCESGGYPWLTPADLSNNGSMSVSRGKRNLTDQGLRTSSAKLMTSGSVLMSSRAPIGYIAVAANPISTNQGFKSFVCADGLQPEFVAYWLRYIRPLLERMGSGTTFSEISGSRAKEIPLHFAPLAEQKRIVARIDVLLARVDAARARLAKIPAILRRFRQSVLAAACSGRLTADWRDSHSDIEPVTRLLTQVAAARRSASKGRYKDPVPADTTDLSDIPATWVWASVDSLALKVVDGVHKTPQYVDSGVPFLTVRNLTSGPGITFANFNSVTESDHASFCERANPEKGDLLVSKDGTLGVVRAIRTDRPFSIFVTLALIKPVSKKLTDYLEIALSSPQVQEQMTGTGSGLQHIHLRDLKADCIPLPPLEEQREIVRRVEALFKLADTIEERVAMATARANKLSQSVLAKAFRSELVPTEADLARREGRGYESASELLTRLNSDFQRKARPKPKVPTTRLAVVLSHPKKSIRPQ